MGCEHGIKGSDVDLAIRTDALLAFGLEFGGQMGIVSIGQTRSLVGTGDRDQNNKKVKEPSETGLAEELWKEMTDSKGCMMQGDKWSLTVAEPAMGTPG